MLDVDKCGTDSTPHLVNDNLVSFFKLDQEQLASDPDNWIININEVIDLHLIIATTDYWHSILES